MWIVNWIFTQTQNSHAMDSKIITKRCHDWLLLLDFPGTLHETKILCLPFYHNVHIYIYCQANSSI